MGTTQKIADNKIRKVFKIGALVAIPLMALGSAAMLFQFYAGDNQEIGLYDFTLGKLWPWSEKNKTKSEEVVQIPEEFELQPTKRKFTKLTPKSSKSYQEVVKISRNVQKKTNELIPLAKVKEETPSLNAIESADFKSPDLGMVRRSGKTIDLLEKEYLIGKNIAKKRTKYAVGASFAPSISFRHLRYTSMNAVARFEDNKAYTNGQSLSYREKNDASILNFYSGIDAYVYFGSKWSLQSGIYYSSHGEQLMVAPVESISNQRVRYPAVDETDPFNGLEALYTSPEIEGVTEDDLVPFNNYYTYFELPLFVSYRLKSFNKTSIELQAGGSYALLNRADAILYNYSSNQYYWIPETDFEYINKHYLFAGGGVIISQYISNDVELFANPQFKYSITPTFNTDYQVKQNQYATGLRLGMKVNL